jgi:Uma2 family endonuclease
MSTLAPPPTFDTVADVLDRAGGVPPSRVLFRPYPGTATEADLLAAVEREKRLCELVDGILVAKTMGHYEARVATVLSTLLENHAFEHDLGIVLGADATLRIRPGLVRLPDVSYYSWSHFPNRELPDTALLPLTPDLAVEVLSEGNTPQEMERKLREYFGGGCRLVSYADPKARSVRVYTAPETSAVLGETDSLDGGEVVPGFLLRVGDWFDRAGPLAR